MSGGGSSSSSDSRFARNGTVNTASWRDLSSDQTRLFNDAFNVVDDGTTNRNVTNLVNDKLGSQWSGVPYSDAITKVVKSNLPGNPVPGQASLESQAAVNPYSGEYADNTFARYADEVQRAMGQSRSGPMASRGGEAAQGYMMADAVNQLGLNREQMLSQHRQADAATQQGASNLLGQQQGRMDSTALQGTQAGFGGYFNLLQDQTTAASLASDRAKAFGNLVPSYINLASRMNGSELNNLVGRGSQSSSTHSGGMNCCFIFLEAYNGVLPESVRRYRDMAAPENSKRRNGYISMSRWLVPAMRVSGFARVLVNHLLVKPLASYGEWFYKRQGFGWVFWPVKVAWFKVWESTGQAVDNSKTFCEQ